MHKQIEEYLAAFNARLGKLPAAQREDELREIRQHLELLVASHRAHGKSEEEAVALAISQFGRAERLGSELKRVNSKSKKLYDFANFLEKFSFWGCFFAIYGFFTSMNDKPTDFPHFHGEQLIVSAVLAFIGFSIKRSLAKKKIKA